MNILVSACLLGLPCRYDGLAKRCPEAIALGQAHHLVPFCPEIYGGLPTPRPPAERVGARVMTRCGADVTAQYARGARMALEICALTGCRAALLKARSPSCGSGQIYDGTFTGTLTQGAGVTARLLADQGVRVFDEAHIASLTAFLAAARDPG